MPKLYSSRDIVITLEKNGFYFVSQKGSHAKYRRNVSEKIITVIVPMAKKEIPRGTLRSILRQSLLSEDCFRNKK
jgi:predicted RNA binding protein YcfA (HicA-like mRNA interferase family)